jgi:MFS family permease
LSTNLTQSCDGAIAASADANVRRPGRPRAVLAATILASSLAFIDGSVLNVALPAIGAAFEASAAEVQWVINAFLLPLSALILIGGAMADLYGRKRLLIVGTGLLHWHR